MEEKGRVGDEGVGVEEERERGLMFRHTWHSKLFLGYCICLLYLCYNNESNNIDNNDNNNIVVIVMKIIILIILIVLLIIVTIILFLEDNHR